MGLKRECFMQANLTINEARKASGSLCPSFLHLLLTLYIVCSLAASSRRMTQYASVACGILTKHPKWLPVAGMDLSNTGTEWPQLPRAQAITSWGLAANPGANGNFVRRMEKCINDRKFYPSNPHLQLSNNKAAWFFAFQVKIKMNGMQAWLI